MTFAAYETGAVSGRPVELFEFAYGTTYYRYTSGTEPVVKSGSTFEPATIQRTTIASSNDNNQSTLSVAAHNSVLVADLFRAQAPAGVITLTVFARHLDDPDAQFAVLWLGRVLNCAWSGNEIEFSCEPINVSLKRNGLRRLYGVSCPHVLYRSGCNLAAPDFRTTALNGNFSVSGNTVTVPALAASPAGYFAGGYIEYLNPVTGNTDSFSIRWSVGGEMTLGTIPQNLADASNVKVHPGCSHTVSDCKNKFNNLPNYGGQPFFPALNPFGGTSLF